MRKRRVSWAEELCQHSNQLLIFASFSTRFTTWSILLISLTPSSCWNVPIFFARSRLLSVPFIQVLFLFSRHFCFIFKKISVSAYTTKFFKAIQKNDYSKSADNCGLEAGVDFFLPFCDEFPSRLLLTASTSSVWLLGEELSRQMHGDDLDCAKHTNLVADCNGVVMLAVR